MGIFKVAAIALTGVLVAALLKTINKDIAIYVILATVMILLFSIIDDLIKAFDFIENIYNRATYGKTFFPVIIKVLAVAYIADFTAQICRDAGESSVAGKVEMAGKVIIFCLAIPILTSILQLITSLLA